MQLLLFQSSARCTRTSRDLSPLRPPSGRSRRPPQTQWGPLCRLVTLRRATPSLWTERCIKTLILTFTWIPPRARLRGLTAGPRPARSTCRRSASLLRQAKDRHSKDLPHKDAVLTLTRGRGSRRTRRCGGRVVSRRRPTRTCWTSSTTSRAAPSAWARWSSSWSLGVGGTWCTSLSRTSRWVRALQMLGVQVPSTSRTELCLSASWSAVLARQHI